MASSEGGIDDRNRRRFLGRAAVVIAAAAASASGVSNLMRPEPEPASKEMVAMRREKRVLNTQIRVLNSFRERDFMPVIQGSGVKEREDKFTKLLDDRFQNMITDVSSDIKTESRDGLIEWFHDDKDMQNASTPGEMEKIVKMKQRLLGRKFNSPKKESLNGATDKLKQ